MTFLTTAFSNIFRLMSGWSEVKQSLKLNSSSFSLVFHCFTITVQVQVYFNFSEAYFK